MSTNKYRIPELRSSLCGCSLETASKIIGWFNLVFDSLTVVGAIIVNIGLMSYYESKEYREAEAKNNDAMMIFLAGFGVLAWFVAFYGILQVLINLLLLKGVYEKKSSYIWPWVVCQLVCVVFSLIFDLFFDYNIRKQVSNHPGDLAVSIVAEIFGLVITLYCIWLVYSYYRQLKRQNDDLPAYEPHVYPV